MLHKVNLLSQHVVARNQAELIKIFNQAGIDRTNARKWHRDFEKASPEEHEKLLETMGFNEVERKEVIQLAQSQNTKE